MSNEKDVTTFLSNRVFLGTRDDDLDCVRSTVSIEKEYDLLFTHAVFEMQIEDKQLRVNISNKEWFANGLARVERLIEELTKFRMATIYAHQEYLKRTRPAPEQDAPAPQPEAPVAQSVALNGIYPVTGGPL